MKTRMPHIDVKLQVLPRDMRTAAQLDALGITIDNSNLLIRDRRVGKHIPHEIPVDELTDIITIGIQALILFSAPPDGV